MPLQHVPKAQGKEKKPPLIANDNAFLGDVINSQPDDPSNTLSAGFYRQEKGTPLTYTYTYDEMKIIIEGSLHLKDEEGNEVNAGPGDVFFFPAGTTITFNSEDYSLAYFVGLRQKDAA